MRLMMRMVLSSSLRVLAQRQFDVLADGHRVEQRPALEGDAHVLPEVEHLVGAHLRDVLAEQLDAARGRLVQAEQVAQERALARTAAAHDDHDLALRGGEVDLVEDLPRAVVGDEIADLDGVGTHLRTGDKMKRSGPDEARRRRQYTVVRRGGVTKSGAFCYRF
jgi:hypothetical protein